MRRTHSSPSHRLAIVTVAGIVHYLVFTKLLGFGAAIAAPSWYAPFLREHQALGLALMSLVTHLPMIAISAAIVGYAIASFLPNRHFFYGLLAVCVTVLFSAILQVGGNGFWMQLRDSVMPRYLFAAPTVVAIWLFLPAAAYWFGRAKSRAEFGGYVG
ncbi:MAG: hypothetical protein AAF270_12975 [Pseudomonadota bacterium]